MAAGDGDRERAELTELAGRLRAASVDAISAGSPLAPALDDCRVDVERLLAAPLADRRARHAIILRSTLTLDTWRRILAARAGHARCCRSCGLGSLVERTRAGRVVRFRGVDIELPADLVIPTCERCGAESLDGDAAAMLDALVFSAWLARR